MAALFIGSLVAGVPRYPPSFLLFLFPVQSCLLWQKERALLAKAALMEAWPRHGSFM